MPRRHLTEDQPAVSRRRVRRPVVVLGVGAGLAAAALAGIALAGSPPTVGTAKNPAIGRTIAVDGRGLTVYELRPETIHHLLCKKAAGCFRFWPPVRVASARARLTAARGVRGKLAILHRNGIFQVTLAGHPLYRFAGDAGRRGVANGQGIRSFGGIWHVVVAASAPSASSTAPARTTIPYGYAPVRRTLP